jgi:hypothetical protein
MLTVFIIYLNEICQTWWYVPMIPALRWLRQEDCKLEASIVSPCLKNKQKPTKKGIQFLTNTIIQRDIRKILQFT